MRGAAVLVALCAAGVRGDAVPCHHADKMTASDGFAADKFGGSVSIQGTTVVVGAWLDDDGGSKSGSAYLFECTPNVTVGSEPNLVTQCVHVSKIHASDGAQDDIFGRSVSMDGDLVVVGAQFDAIGGHKVGSAYVFDCSNTSDCWQLKKLVAPDGEADDWFGRSVSVSTPVVVVGASFDDDHGSGSGSVYVFECNATDCSMYPKVTADDADSGDNFGSAVAVANGGAVVVVGAPGDDDLGSQAGSAYVFDCSSGVCEQMHKLTASNGGPLDRFGGSVAVDGDIIVIGSYLFDGPVPNSGNAYVMFQCGDGATGNCTETSVLQAKDADTGDQFGWSVAVSSYLVVVGAHRDGPQGLLSGSAYVYDCTNITSCEQTHKLIPADGGASDFFGRAVSVSGGSVAVSSWMDDDVATDSGAVYLFDECIEYPSTPTAGYSTPTAPRNTPTAPRNTPTVPLPTPTPYFRTPTMPGPNTTQAVDTPTAPFGTPTSRATYLPICCNNKLRRCKKPKKSKKICWCFGLDADEEYDCHDYPVFYGDGCDGFPQTKDEWKVYTKKAKKASNDQTVSLEESCKHYKIVDPDT